MSSTKALARTLPRKAPNTERHRATLNGLGRYRFAIYNTAPLDAEDRHQLEASINSGELSTKNSKLAPQPDFSNRSLRDVYDYHIQVRDEDETIHPLYFIVADRIDSPNDGVLVVLLNSSQDEQDVVGVGRCGIDMADSWGSNIDIGNQDWFDLKEEEAEMWGGDDPYADDGDDGDDGDDKRGTSQNTAAQTSSPSNVTVKRTYGWYSLVKKAVPISSMLEPEWRNMKAGQSRFQMLGNFHSSNDPWAEVRMAHPRQCAIRPNIHRTLVIVAEKENANEPDGVTLVRLKWNGDTTGIEDRSPPLKPDVEIISRLSADQALGQLDQAK